MEQELQLGVLRRQASGRFLPIKEECWFMTDCRGSIFPSIIVPRPDVLLYLSIRIVSM